MRSFRHVLWMTLLVALCMAGLPRRATADAATETAATHNATAKKAFNLGKFDEAIVAYEKAYKAKPLPVFLFNLAQCYMRGKQTSTNLRRAVHYFESFLHNQPDAPNAAAVRTKMAELGAKADKLEVIENRAAAEAAAKKAAAEAAAKKAAAEAAAKKAAAANNAQPATHPATTILITPDGSKPKASGGRPFYKKWWFWTIVGAAAIGGGVAIGAVATRPDTRKPEGPQIDWTSFGPVP